MTHSEMLKRMGLTEKEFRHLLARYREFYDSLSEPEKAVVRRSLPTLEQAAKSFGPDVKPEEMQEFFGADASAGVFNSEIAALQPNNGDDDD